MLREDYQPFLTDSAHMASVLFAIFESSHETVSRGRGNDAIHFYVVKFFSIMPLVIPSGLWTPWSLPLLSDNVSFPDERVGEEALPYGAGGLPPHCLLGEPGIHSFVQTPSCGFGVDLMSSQPLCFHCWNGPGKSS